MSSEAYRALPPLLDPLLYPPHGLRRPALALGSSFTRPQDVRVWLCSIVEGLQTQSGRRGPLGAVVWSCSNGKRSPRQPTAPYFRARLKRLLDTDVMLGRRLGARFQEFGMAFFDDLPKGKGRDVAYAPGKVLNLAIGLELVRFGCKPKEVVEALAECRQMLQNVFDKMNDMITTRGRARVNKLNPRTGKREAVFLVLVPVPLGVVITYQRRRMEIISALGGVRAKYVLVTNRRFQFHDTSICGHVRVVRLHLSGYRSDRMVVTVFGRGSSSCSICYILFEFSFADLLRPSRQHAISATR